MRNNIRLLLVLSSVDIHIVHVGLMYDAAMQVRWRMKHFILLIVGSIALLLGFRAARRAGGKEGGR